ncbi:hypothetical protein P3T40_006807 [Paraburkholderia sp. EB58]|uniref:hypothetical protein n=1 Tax=Paraburkholderia sp. EB58 TaxID=3035125 RepID=UPI003D24F45F
MSNVTLQSAATSLDVRHSPAGSQLRTIAACSIGNALEMYDFTVYSFFAMLIGKLFFPVNNAYTSLLIELPFTG